MGPSFTECHRVVLGFTEFFSFVFFLAHRVNGGFRGGIACRAGRRWLAARKSAPIGCAFRWRKKKQNGRIQNVSYRVSFVVSAIGWHLFFCKPNFSLKLISCNGTCYRIKYLSLLFGGTYLPSFTEFLFTCMRVGWFHSVVFSFLFWVHQIGGRKLRIWNRRPTMIGQWEAFPFFFFVIFSFSVSPLALHLAFTRISRFPFSKESSFFFFSFPFFSWGFQEMKIVQRCTVLQNLIAMAQCLFGFSVLPTNCTFLLPWG